ncbi:hypothetical protein RvY_02599 [Ramazzottius varieornatus]|uniref:Uncharacterized protein n=1 Tax=Ramazzottius varieornatus TaxID=947166 RepID=A0A1D1UP08_RAMVA|nr:hypothetical protein RvY_02599 [Ramazzottius varieornatus]
MEKRTCKVEQLLSARFVGGIFRTLNVVVEALPHPRVYWRIRERAENAAARFSTHATTKIDVKTKWLMKKAYTSLS